MVILEYPIEFGLLPEWLQESQHPVLANDCTRELVNRGLELNLVDEDDAIRRIDEGERVYTCTEMALEWITTKTDNENLIRAIETCKDKASLRRAVQATDPDLFFRECSAAELSNLDYHSLPERFVIKPNRGFCSFGVFTVESEDDWQRSLIEIEGGLAANSYSKNVIDETGYIIEQFIDGTEYALDLYFDDDGVPHVLNVMRHDFASDTDTSDRLYITSPSIIETMLPRFEEWASRLNEQLDFSNFCLHAEVRVQDDIIRPIEFNPLRFAGLGGTDLSRYAYGYYTYESYLNNEAPRWESALAGKDGQAFIMSLAMKDAALGSDCAFDIDAYCAPIDRVFAARMLDTAATGAWTFIFGQTCESNSAVFDHLLNANLNDYVR